MLAAILLIPLTVLFAQLLGAGTRGAWLAAIAAASATLVTAMTATLNTSTFEPFDFTATAYLVTRAFLRNEPRLYWWAGAFAGFAFETRYGIRSGPSVLPQDWRPLVRVRSSARAISGSA